MTHQDILVKKAKQSICRYKVSALGLDRKGNYIGVSMNKPFLSHFRGGIHAEIALMKRYGPRLKTIIICRVNKNGDILPIDPCPVCRSAANDLGIKIISIAG